MLTTPQMNVSNIQRKRGKLSFVYLSFFHSRLVIRKSSSSYVLVDQLKWERKKRQEWDRGKGLGWGERFILPLNFEAN